MQRCKLVWNKGLSAPQKGKAVIKVILMKTNDRGRLVRRAYSMQTFSREGRDALSLMYYEVKISGYVYLARVDCILHRNCTSEVVQNCTL